MKNRIFKIVLLLCIPFLGNVNALSNPHGGPVPIRILIQEDSRNLWMWGLGFFGLCCVGRFAVQKYPQVQERFKKFPALKNISDYLVNSYLKRNGQVAINREDVDALVQGAETVAAAAQQAVDKAEELKTKNKELEALLQKQQAEAQQSARAQESRQTKGFWRKFFGCDSSAQQSPSQAQNNPFSGVEPALERFRKHRQANQAPSLTALRQRLQITELSEDENLDATRRRLVEAPTVSSTATFGFPEVPVPMQLSQVEPTQINLAAASRLFGQTSISAALNSQSHKKRTLLGSFQPAIALREMPKNIVGLKPRCLVVGTNRLGS